MLETLQNVVQVDRKRDLHGTLVCHSSGGKTSASSEERKSRSGIAGGGFPLFWNTVPHLFEPPDLADARTGRQTDCTHVDSDSGSHSSHTLPCQWVIPFRTGRCHGWGGGRRGNQAFEPIDPS